MTVLYLFLLIIILQLIQNFQLHKIKNKIKKMTISLDELKAKVDAEETVEQSAITLLQGLSAQLKDAKNDPAKIQAIADEIDSDSANLAAAVAANS
jgi:hypothetical protein